MKQTFFQFFLGTLMFFSTTSLPVFSNTLSGRHMIKPWIAEVFPKAFPDWHCEVIALELKRSFWEKATILHAEYHRSPDKQMPDRYSRHYADTAMLAKHTESML